MAKLKSIRLGKTINKSNFESLRIDVEIEATSARETVDALAAEAEALVDYIASGAPKNARMEALVVDQRTIVRKYNGKA